MREALNAFIIEQRSLAKDSPAKTWWHLPHDHPAIARALRIDRTQDGAWYALMPFRYAKINDRHLILAAYPVPRIFETLDPDWLGIDAVLAWDPATNAVEVMGEPGTHELVGRVTEMDSTIYADPRAFFTAWMRQRAWYIAARKEASQRAFAAIPKEPDLLPGVLIVGDPEKVAWPLHSMPERFTCVGIDPKRVNRAILKFAKLPMCAGLDLVRAA
jgi:hypothetical protein